MRHNPWVAALLNFLFMGGGYLYLGCKVPQALAFTLGSLVLVYVQIELKSLNLQDYWIMFWALLAINLAFAWDAYQEARARAPRAAELPEVPKAHRKPPLKLH